MFQNYFKIALRNLWKNRTFTFVNVIGIAFSITAFLFILEYISFERGVNTFHKNLPNLYRVLSQDKMGKTYGYSQSALASTLQQNFGEVKSYCRIAEDIANGIVTYSQQAGGQNVQSFREENAIYADADFFKLFSFPIIAGNASLQQANTVAIARSQAKKYFNTDNAIGKMLTLHNQFGTTSYTVSAVFKDVPKNSDLQFDMVFALQTLANPANLNGNIWADLNSWDSYFVKTYLLLANNSDYKALEKKINAFKIKMFPESKDLPPLLQPMRYMHLGKNLNENYDTFGNLGFVYLIGSIGLLILIIAWLNYINLSTASSLKRAKEVGIRKVVGANRGQLAGQFLGESLLLNLGGFVIAAGLVQILQPGFNQLIGKDLSAWVLLQNSAWIFGLLLLLAGLMVSGGYVAYILSGFPTADTLKGTFSKSLKGVLLRKSLVVFQFTISVVLIAATLILYRQLQFMQNQNLGVSLEQRVVITAPEVVEEGTYKPKSIAFQNEVAQLPFVKKYSNAGVVPGNDYNFSTAGITRLNPNPEDDKKDYKMAIIDNFYLDAYDIKLAAGNNFTSAMCEKGWGESHKVMINEKAAAAFGFVSAAAAVGQQILWGVPFEIVGVVKDYHHQSLRQAIDPIIFLPRAYTGNTMVLLPTNQIQANMKQLERLYRQTFPGNPFEYFFVDETFDKQYAAEKQYGLLFFLASGLAILISCLGLFGLATFSVEQKTKEIGIRKVLGASVSNIVTLISKDFLLLVIIAFVIATPIAWWAANQWLQDFAYRAELSWWIFGIAGVLAGLIAVLTVSFQAIRAAVANPVESLKNE